MAIDRILSVVVAACWLIGFYFWFGVGGPALFSSSLVFLWLGGCLTLIWFGDAIGVMPFRGTNITSETPGIFYKVAGWCLLLLPAVFFVFLVVDVHAVWRTLIN